MKNPKIIKALETLTDSSRPGLMNVMVEHDGGTKRTLAACNGVLLLSAEFHDATQKEPVKGYLTGDGVQHCREHLNWKKPLKAPTGAPTFTVSLDKLDKMVKALKTAMGERRRGDQVGIEFRVDHPTDPVQIRVSTDDVLKARDGSDVMVSELRGLIMPLNPNI